MLLSLLSLLGTASAEHPLLLGQVFPEAPTHLGPLLDNPGDPTIEAMQAHLAAHDLDAALWEARRFTEEHRWGRERDIAWMVQGFIHREEGRHNLASAAFTKVRASKGPLRAFGAWFEAEQDLARGKHWVAARECESYRKTWPKGRHAQDCHRLMAVAYARAGSWSKARATAKAYDQKNKDAPIGEQVELTLTLDLLADKPEKAVQRLREHATDFTAPLTGRIAAEKLLELERQGVDGAGLPTDLPSRRRRARSLRRTKQTAEAWHAFAELVMDSSADGPEMGWLEGEAETFGWRTRNWDFLARLYAADYAEKPTAEIAWKHYRVLSRGGRYAEAITVAENGLEKHAKSRQWRYKEESLAQSYMLGGAYAGARDLYDTVAKRGGWTGRRGRFYAAFSGFMAADDDDDTLKRLTTIVEANSKFAHQARYWRAQLHDRMGDTAAGDLDREAVVAENPDSWYGALVRARRAADDETTQARSGRWPGAPEPIAPTFVGEPLDTHRSEWVDARPTMASARPASSGFGLLTWTSGLQAEPLPEPVPAFLEVDPDLPPPSYLTSVLFDPRGASARFKKWASRNKAAWPDVEAALDLARGGLYDLSGPLFSAVYEEWRAAYRSRGSAKHLAARNMKLDPGGWRELFSYTRDHHHTARFNHSSWESMEDPEQALAARKIGYPLAHDRYVWTHSRQHDVDPYLILGLMRQESTYNSIARSPVGARGAMQIMPRTGHLLANLQTDLSFDAGDLEDPVFSVGYGIRYLGLLLDRFEGAYPLAIASYNGGPFNVSSWLAGTGRDMPMDAFVEHIPFRETRDYVKKVSAGYSAYLSIYTPENTLLIPPETPRGDHADVVDF